MTPPDIVSASPLAASADRPRSRRALLAGLAGGAGALLAGAIDRVRFLHPVEHGKAESQGVDYETRQQQRRYALLGPKGSPVG
jgi:hypothetical protein